MLENYVKFLRGTPEAYNRLAKKDVDTLYFISEPEAATGMLYLGSKLIAGGISGDLTLSDLKDIALSESITDGQILVYDSENGWVNANLDEIIGVFGGAGVDHAGLPGLVPAPAPGQTDAFLKSDGTWSNITLSQNIITKVNSDGVEHSVLLAEIENPAIDDITIIKDIIVIGDEEVNNKYQHTAYIYKGENWEALDGNYSAENVYFKNDFIFTESVGTVEVPLETGNITVPAAGLNVKQFLAKIFAEEKEPTVTLPTITLTATPTATSYEVGSELKQGYNTSFYAGSYQFGPNPTGVNKISQTITDSVGNELTDASGTFPAQTVTDGFSYHLSCYASYSDGSIPKTNLNSDCEAKKISAGDTTTVKSSTITGYRNSFYGTTTEKKETLTSADIRALQQKSGKAYANNSSFDVNVNKDCLRVIIAYPATLRDMTQVLDKNDSNSNIISAFGEPTIVEVEGANGYDAIEYKVYKVDFANPYDTTNIFKVTI